MLYRIIREVGRGGMGVVYEAEQVSLGRHVALKVLPKEMHANAKHPLRFEREARAAAKLHHTNIVPVFGVGFEEQQCYYVMQFIQGQALDKVLEELFPEASNPGRRSDSRGRRAGLPRCRTVARSATGRRRQSGGLPAVSRECDAGGR